MSVQVKLELNRQTFCDLAGKKNMIDTVGYSMTEDWIKLNFSIPEEEFKKTKILNYILVPNKRKIKEQLKENEE